MRKLRVRRIIQYLRKWGGSCVFISLIQQSGNGWKWNEELSGGVLYCISAALWDWIIPWKRSLTVEGSKALTYLYTSKPFIIYFWRYSVLKQMMHLQWRRISAYDTCGNSFLSEYLTMTVDTFKKRKEKSWKKTQNDWFMFTVGRHQQPNLFLAGNFVFGMKRLVCTRQPIVFCIFCNSVFTTITGLKM